MCAVHNLWCPKLVLFVGTLSLFCYEPWSGGNWGHMFRRKWPVEQRSRVMFSHGLSLSLPSSPMFSLGPISLDPAISYLHDTSLKWLPVTFFYDIHLHIRLSIHIRLPNIYIYIYVCVYLYTYVYIYIYVCVCICIHMYMYIYI